MEKYSEILTISRIRISSININTTIKHSFHVTDEHDDVALALAPTLHGIVTRVHEKSQRPRR